MWEMGAWIYIGMVMFGSCCHASSEASGKVGKPWISANGGQVLDRDEARQSLKLLFISGFHAYPGYGLITKTVTKIDPYTANSSCEHVADYPQPVDGGVAENIGNQLVISCGSNGGDMNFKKKTCYSLNLNVPHQEWEEYTQISEWKNRMTSVQLSNEDVWVLGGMQGDDKLQSTDIINTITRRSRRGPDLPEAMDYPCAVKIDAQFVYIGASNEDEYGHPTGKTSFIVDVLKEPFEFKRIPDMIDTRPKAGCGFIKMENGEPAVIVAGGDGSGQTSEMFLIEKNQWVKGPRLPCTIIGASTVNPDDKTFLLNGGAMCDIYNDPGSIFQLDLVTMQFVTLPGKLTFSRFASAMTWVMDDEQC